MLLTGRASLPTATRTELARLKPGRIVVLGGPSVVAQAVLDQLDAYTTGPVSRLAGTDRYATAAAISSATFARGVDVAYVATGENYPDALAAVPRATADGAPLLLTRRNAIPAATSAELQRLAPGRIVLLGGTLVVSEAVRVALGGLTTAPVTRLAGADRYGTAAAIAAGFAAPAAHAYLANGSGFADALAGGPAAPLRGAPLLLAARDSLPGSTGTQHGRQAPRQMWVLGGLVALSDEVAAAAAVAAR
jgi:putative cell wall-binding protein